MSNEVVTECYDLIEKDHFRKGAVVPCFIKHYLTCVIKLICVLTLKVFSDRYYLPKSKPFIVGFPYRSPKRFHCVNLYRSNLQ